MAAVICAITCLQSAHAVGWGAAFILSVRRSVRESAALRTADGGWRYQPRAAVILPCCGVDDRLEDTVRRLCRQEYGNYEVIFTFESADDPAYEAVGRWTADASDPPRRRIVAGVTPHRGQKIHNLLAALGQVRDDCEVFAFFDTDAVPGLWALGHLVAPLKEESVGAATGFRWYCAAGGLANGVRCLWNAAAVSLMERRRTRFCWGGAMAMTRRRFEELHIAGRWQRALSDDLQVTRAVREAGLDIRFVPQALVPSHDRTDLRGFVSFARRQLIITRICAPRVWWAGLLLCGSFVMGGTVAAAAFFACLLGWIGSSGWMWLFLAAWMMVVVSATAKAALRQAAVRQVLGPPDLTWLDTWWDVGGAVSAGTLHFLLFLTSIGTNRIRWRHISYELLSPDDTRIVQRHGPSKSAT